MVENADGVEAELNGVEDGARTTQGQRNRRRATELVTNLVAERMPALVAELAWGICTCKKWIEVSDKLAVGLRRSSNDDNKRSSIGMPARVSADDRANATDRSAEPQG